MNGTSVKVIHLKPFVVQEGFVVQSHYELDGPINTGHALSRSATHRGYKTKPRLSFADASFAARKTPP